MSKPLLIISGPTATGKTALAVKLAKKYQGELISADSRQIYRGMDIGTGKDHPPGVKIHLVDLITPDQSFSVAQYQKFALAKITEIQSRGKLPIVVGGTGQYIDSLINPHTETFSVKPNQFLRFFLNKLPLNFLQFTLKTLNFKTFKLLNNSDLHNPHRLIRKIEISLSPKVSKFENFKFENFLHISLTASNSFLYQQIDQRVEQRLRLGLIDEIKTLLTTYFWSDPGLNTLAYKQFQPFFNKKSSLESCITVWRFAEHAYARRQKTWFKKKPNLYFFDVSQPNYFNRLVAFLDQCYNKP